MRRELKGGTHRSRRGGWQQVSAVVPMRRELKDIF